MQSRERENREREIRERHSSRGGPGGPGQILGGDIETRLLTSVVSFPVVQRSIEVATTMMQRRIVEEISATLQQQGAGNSKDVSEGKGIWKSKRFCFVNCLHLNN